jgi:hypothetical protein
MKMGRKHRRSPKKRGTGVVSHQEGSSSGSRDAAKAATASSGHTRPFSYWNVIGHGLALIGVGIALWQVWSVREQLSVAKNEYELHRLDFESEHSPVYRFRGELLSKAPCIIVTNEGPHAPVLRGICRAIVVNGKKTVEIKNYYHVAHSAVTDRDILHFYFDKSLSASTFAGRYWKGVDPINIVTDEADRLQLHAFVRLDCKDDRGIGRTDHFEMMATGELAQRADRIPDPDCTVDLLDYYESNKEKPDEKSLNLDRLAADVKSLAMDEGKTQSSD